MSEANVPSPGLYRTTMPLPGKGDKVPAGRLVYFADKTEHDKPAVLLPAKVIDNQWQFSTGGFLVEDAGWPLTLVKLPKQGFYRVQKAIYGPGGTQLPENLLIQLGYTAAGQPVAFPGTLAPGAQIHFAKKGMLLTDLQLDNVDVVDFKLFSLPNATPKPQVAKPAAK